MENDSEEKQTSFTVYGMIRERRVESKKGEKLIGTL
jgi:hypothetical protein